MLIAKKLTTGIQNGGNGNERIINSSITSALSLDVSQIVEAIVQHEEVLLGVLIGGVVLLFRGPQVWSNGNSKPAHKKTRPKPRFNLVYNVVEVRKFGSIQH